MFLCLLSYLVLFVKPSLLEINEEMTFLMENKTCSEDEMFCSISKTSKGCWSFLQLIINIWVFMFALEEFRQVKKHAKNYNLMIFFSILKAKLFKTKENSIGQTFILYLGESWNKLDALCIIMYLASITLESWNTKTTLNAARFVLYSKK
jgi:ATP-dependent Zn protease